MLQAIVVFTKPIRRIHSRERLAVTPLRYPYGEGPGRSAVAVGFSTTTRNNPNGTETKKRSPGGIRFERT